MNSRLSEESHGYVRVRDSGREDGRKGVLGLYPIKAAIGPANQVFPCRPSWWGHSPRLTTVTPESSPGARGKNGAISLWQVQWGWAPDGTAQLLHLGARGTRHVEGANRAPELSTVCGHASVHAHLCVCVCVCVCVCGGSMQ